MVVCHNRSFALYNFSAYQPRRNCFPTLFLAIFSLLDRIKWISKNPLQGPEIKDEAKHKTCHFLVLYLGGGEVV